MAEFLAKLINMHFGYVRFFDSSENLTFQLSELQKFGCMSLWIETAGHAARKYPEFEKLKLSLSKGDYLVVFKREDLGTEAEFIDLLIELGQNHIHTICIQERIDTSNEFASVEHD
ncbi:recombinase family protein [Dyadobacter sp.]|uniref:recombinase family protein n=1 Tax=Dyadobacter sp. TaxID=1914288 RepID=UPI003F71287A